MQQALSNRSYPQQYRIILKPQHQIYGTGVFLAVWGVFAYAPFILFKISPDILKFYSKVCRRVLASSIFVCESIAKFKKVSASIE